MTNSQKNNNSNNNFAISTKNLRKALGYDKNTMDDAVECIERILSQIRKQDQFGHSIIEQQICGACARSETNNTQNQQAKFTELIHYVPATSLLTAIKSNNNHNQTQKQHQNQQQQLHFGTLLRLAGSTSVPNIEGQITQCPVNPKTCPGSRKTLQKRRSLTNTPDILAVSLCWERENPSVASLTDILYGMR